MKILKITTIAVVQTLVSSWTVLASTHASETDPEECTSLLQRQVQVQPKDNKVAIAVHITDSTFHVALQQENGTMQSSDKSKNHEVESVSLLMVPVRMLEKARLDEYNWPSHIFGHPKERHVLGMWAHHDAHDWFVLMAFIMTMLLTEVYIIRPWFTQTPKTGLGKTGPVVLCWTFAALLFNLYVGRRHGSEDAVKWMNGYLLEWMLSMDNIFVFHLVFKLYKTPPCLFPKALFWGVVGALLFRMLFFVALNSLLEVMHLCRYIFGLFLMWSGVQALRADDDDDDLADSWPVRALNWLLADRLLPAPHYDMQGRLLITAKKETGQSMTYVSMLVPVILCLELTDILFAVDSVSAKVGQIPDQFVAYSSSVFAMFGLRSLFFVMEDLVNTLRFLKYGLCFILVFIGVELLLADFITLPATAVCIVLVVVFAACGTLSVLFPDSDYPEAVGDKDGDPNEPEKTPTTY